MENLAAKYRPKTLSDVVEQEAMISIVKNICESKEVINRNFLFIGPAGCGKAQPLDSLILTPSGYKRMGDLQIGDEVITHNGNIGKVSGVFPQGVRPIYKIVLQDRTSIEVSDEHLNVFYRYNEDKKQRENYCMTTLELLEFINKSRFKLRVDIPQVDWEAQPVLMDPYLVGALIGDGSLSGNLCFSNSEEDVIEKVDSILRRDWGKMLKKCPGDNVDYSICSIEPATCRYVFTYKGETYLGGEAMSSKLVSEGYPRFDGYTLYKLSKNECPIILKRYPELASKLECTMNENYRDWTEGDHFMNALRTLRLLCKSTEKRIPESYLFNSREIRIALLQGLFDTDGYTANTCGVTSFNTCSDGLSKDFAFLVRSLGIRDTVVDSPSRYKSKGKWIYTGTTSHEHNLKIPNELQYCSSDKHLSRRTIKQNPPMRNIESIEYAGDKECQCIMVDHPDHTYISTEGFIPTHNTTTARIIANELNEGKGEPIEIDAASHSGVDSMRDIMAQARVYPVGSKYKIFIIDECHALSPAAWQSALLTIESQPAMTIFCWCTTNPEKIPATILSRVQTFQLSKISLDGIFNRLKYIIQKENEEGAGITYEDDAILFLAKMAGGGMRNAITSLDQTLMFDKNITIQSIEKSLGLPNYDNYFDLLNAIAKKDNEKIISMINSVYNSGVNFVKWFEGFFSFITNIVKFIYLQDIQQTMIPGIYLDKISKYGTPHSVLCLKLSNKLVKLNQELKSTQYLQELAISYLCTAPVVKK